MATPNESVDPFDWVIQEHRRAACPAIQAALPSWPSGINRNALWLDLYPSGTLYTHHPSHGEAVYGWPSTSCTDEECGIRHRPEHLFCVPRSETQRLLSILRNSRGGSILVTGYRGTGKSSLVNYTISELIEAEKGKARGRQRVFAPVRVNLSTSRDAQALVSMMIKELHRRAEKRELGDRMFPSVARAYQRLTAARTITAERSEETRETLSTSGGVSAGGFVSGSVTAGSEEGTTTTRGRSDTDLRYTLHEAQQDLHAGLEEIAETDHYVIFIFDELDKLSPGGQAASEAAYREELEQIERIVADLKFLLTEASAFNIFIAGKEVDDRWQEDQNKGEGLFESVFVQNIYLPSTFTADLSAAAGPHKWIGISRTALERVVADERSKTEHERRSGKEIRSAFAAELFRVIDERRHAGDTRRRPKEVQASRQWIDAVFREVLDEIGVDYRSWTYNTGLIALPHLSVLEMWKVLLRRANLPRETDPLETLTNVVRGVDGVSTGADEQSPDLSVMEWFHAVAAFALSGGFEQARDRSGFLDRLLRRSRSWASASRGRSEAGDKHWGSQTLAEILFDGPVDFVTAEAMSERRCRRIRYLLQYLTYKGRGIPRKILRELYGLVQHTSTVATRSAGYWRARGNIELVIYSPTAVRQKMKFFASIVGEVDAHRGRFRSMNDKACVATFHIVDYVLKHFQTGFSWTDIETATFMTRREELFPSRELVTALLSVLEDTLIEGKDRRYQSYKLLPRVKHDLGGLYLAFGPEQIELRFTRADFAGEFERLSRKLVNVNKTSPEQRLESFKAQMRYAKLFELLGNHQEARHEYSKALRWVRMDLAKLMERMKGEFTTIAKTSLITYLTAATNVLARLGYLYELDREYRMALHYYQSIVRFNEAALAVRTGEDLDCKSLLGHPLCPAPLHVDWPTPESVRTHVLTACEEPAEVSEGQEVAEGGGDRKERFERRRWRLLAKMVPGYECQALPFTADKDAPVGFSDMPLGPPHPLVADYQPLGFADALNRIAIDLEKLWHRYASNRFLLNALDYHIRCCDEFNTIDQMLFIGEVLMRRRDVRLATEWYLEVIARIGAFQKAVLPDRTSKQPEIQATVRARVFEYLGDVFFASEGTAFLDDEVVERHDRDCGRGATAESGGNSLREAVGRAMKTVRRELPRHFFDSRDEEFFYTQAAYHYGMNQQILRKCDVSLKKLLVRRSLLRRTLGRFGCSAEELATCRDFQAKGDAVQAWCSFWVGAERTLSSLIDVTPGSRRERTMAKGRIIDRRRFGELFTSIGRMFMLAARYDLWPWYWDAGASQKNMLGDDREKYVRVCLQSAEEAIEQGLTQEHGFFGGLLQERTNLKRAAECIDRILGYLVDNDDLLRGRGARVEEQGSREIEICRPDGIGRRSPLWNLASNLWRQEGGSTPTRPIETMSPKTGERSTSADARPVPWHDLPNVFLVGPIYYLSQEADAAAEKSTSQEADAAAEKSTEGGESESGREQVRMLYRAEVALLGAHLALDDNIRDLEAASASRSLGIVYLIAIKHLLDLRKRVITGEGLSGDSAKRFDRHLALTYNNLHIAAKRFLVNAIDIYRTERTRARGTRFELTRADQALADLMTVRAEVLGMAERGSTAAEGTLPGLEKPWLALKEVESAQRDHCHDSDPEDVRLQAFEAYRDACRENLSEIEDYIKRYRFPSDVFYAHGDVMDRRLHFQIAKSVHARHYSYSSAGTSESPGENDARGEEESKPSHQAAARLWNASRQLGVVLFDAHPCCSDRDHWLEKLYTTWDLVNRYSSRPNLICIDKIKKNAHGGASHFEVRWAKLVDLETDGDRDRHFFRTFEDGLGRQLDHPFMDSEGQSREVVPEGVGT